MPKNKREKVYFAIAFRLSTPRLSKRLQTRLSSWQPKFFSRHIILMPRWRWLGIDSINIGNVTTILSSVRRSRDVTTTAGPVDVDVLALGVVLVGELRLDAEGVGTEVVTLGLQDVGREVLGAEAVVEGEGGGEGRGRDTPESTLGDDVTPASLGLLDGLVEEVGEQQVLKVGVGTVGSSDVLQEDGADDAATTPHESNLRLLELPAVLLSSL